MQFGEALKENKWPAELKAGLIGSCTNSSYEDMQRAASVAQQALKAGIKAKVSIMGLPCCAYQYKRLISARAIIVINNHRRSCEKRLGPPKI